MKLLLLLNIGLKILNERWNITDKFYQVYDLTYQANLQPLFKTFIEGKKAVILTDLDETCSDCSWKDAVSFNVLHLPKVLILLGLYLPKVRKKGEMANKTPAEWCW